ncbi:hypothetical protein NL479_28460, partial [Klebsiella pneumoniae]|nr:hypothetical protein [Klebsiella pneumoniae]
VADPSVVGGAILLVALSLFGFDFDTVGRRRPGEDAEPSAGASDSTPEAPAADGPDKPAGPVGPEDAAEESKTVGHQAEPS